MRETIVLTLGTTASAVGLDFERRKQELVRRLARRLAKANPPDDAKIKAEIEDIGEVFVLAADVDGTNSYQIHQPLICEPLNWPIGEFHHCVLPGPDMVDRIAQGFARGRFEALNPAAFQSIQTSEHASGGTRANGWLAVEHNAATLEQEIRDRITRILQRRRAMARPQTETIRFILVSGTFGGFGSGSRDAVLRLVRRIARDMQVVLSITSFLLLPGTNPSKDPANTAAVTFGVLSELVAASSGHHWHREQSGGGLKIEMVRSVHVPTILLSDANHAPRKAVALKMENFLGMASAVIWNWIFTDVGERLDAVAGDFQAPSLTPTSSGEPRFGRSAGISYIELDRERIKTYVSMKLASRVLELSLRPVEEEFIRLSARGFFEARHIVLGAGVTTLADRLLNRTDGDVHLVDCERVRQIYRNNTSALKGMDLLSAAGQRLHLSMQQAGNLDAALTARRTMLVRAFIDDLNEEVGRFVRDRQKGPVAAKQWLNTILLFLRQMIEMAAKDTAQHETALQRHQERVQHIENNYIPQIRRRSFIYRRWNRRAIEAAGEQYRIALEQMTLDQMRLKGHNAGIETLKDLEPAVEETLKRVQMAVDAFTDLFTRSDAELKRLLTHPADFRCPVGLALATGRLDEYYERLLPAAGEEHAINDVYTRLVGVEDPLLVAGDPERLDGELHQAAAATFEEPVEALHVVTELHRLFSTPDALAAVLRERDRESFEFIQLKDNVDSENGAHVVRLLAADAALAQNLLGLLGEFGYHRTVPYSLIDTQDRDQIAFIQFRAVFPVSGWAHFPGAKKSYDGLSDSLAFEKFHIHPGERSLPVPGEPISMRRAHLMALKAWLIGRLHYDDRVQVWRLDPPDSAQPEVNLGGEFGLFLAGDGYKYAVDIASHYACEYFARGPEPLLDALWKLVGIRDGQTPATDVTEMRLAELMTDDLKNEIVREVEWWRRNTVPSVMEWAGKPSGNGAGQASAVPVKAS